MDVRIVAHRNNFTTSHPPGFRSRIQKGCEFEKELSRHLKQFGIVIGALGQEFLSDGLKAGIRYLTDATSLFIRFLPDLIAILPDDGGAVLIEVKSTLSRTGNFSVNIASYNFQRDLVINSGPDDPLKLLYIFPPLGVDEDYRAEWVQYLPRAIIRQVINREMLSTSRGSGRPYVLLSGNKLRTLSEVLNELIDSNQMQCAIKL